MSSWVGNEFNYAPQGWQCPVCKRVYSPWVSKCEFCGEGGGNGVVYTDRTNPIQPNQPIREMMVNGIPFSGLGFSRTGVMEDDGK